MRFKIHMPMAMKITELWVVTLVLVADSTYISWFWRNWTLHAVCRLFTYSVVNCFCNTWMFVCVWLILIKPTQLCGLMHRQVIRRWQIIIWKPRRKTLFPGENVGGDQRKPTCGPRIELWIIEPRCRDSNHSTRCSVRDFFFPRTDHIYSLRLELSSKLTLF